METQGQQTAGTQPQAEIFRQMQDLEDPPPPADGEEVKEYRKWGSMRTPEYPEDEHRVFVDNTPWRRAGTLADILEYPDCLQQFSPENVFTLAHQIMLAHLDFSLVRMSCPNPRLEHYTYYQRTIEKESMGDEGPLLLRPYLACGFGRRPPERQPGATFGPLKDPDAPVIELGPCAVPDRKSTKTQLSYKSHGRHS